MKMLHRYFLSGDALWGAEQRTAFTSPTWDGLHRYFRRTIPSFWQQVGRISLGRAVL
jgi:hypothetical protein